MDDFQQLERFIREFEALQTLREKLLAFVHPAEHRSQFVYAAGQDPAVECPETRGTQNHDIAFTSDIQDLLKRDHAVVTGAKTRIEWKCVSTGDPLIAIQVK